MVSSNSLYGTSLVTSDVSMGNNMSKKDRVDVVDNKPSSK